MIIQGGQGSGKTVLATSMIKALQKEVGKPNGKIGKIEASVLNQKDVAALLKKVAGGCLIIEKAGAISRETAVKLGTLLDSDNSGLFVIMEDTRRGIEKALSRDAGFAARFSEKINIPIFTSDELVAFARSYANELVTPSMRWEFWHFTTASAIFKSWIRRQPLQRSRILWTRQSPCRTGRT